MTSAKENDLNVPYWPESRPALWWIAALSALPVATALLSFRVDGEFAFWQLIARQFWLPSQLFEIATIVFALSRGCDVQKEWAGLGGKVRSLAALLLLSILLATGFAETPNTAVLSLISWTIHSLFALSAWFLFRRWQSSSQSYRGNITVMFADAMPIGSAAFVFLMVIFMMMVGISSDYDWVSSLPGFTHIRHSGYFLMPAIALSTGMIATHEGKRRHLHLVLLAINFGFAIWIGSRGPLMAYFGVLAAAVLFFAMMRNARTIGTITLALAGGALMSQAIPTPDHSSFNAVARFEGNNSQSADKLSSGRTEIWRDTWRGVLEHPVLGHGGNQFRLQVPAAKETYNHPHNSVLQLAYEWGLIGAAAMLGLLALLGGKLVRLTFAYPRRNLALFLAASSMTLFSLIDGVFYYNLPIMLFLTCAFGILSQAEPD